MSLSIFHASELSVIALFAQASGFGDAQEIADQLHTANVEAYNARYGEEGPLTSVELVCGQGSSPEGVFRLIRDLKMNSSCCYESYHESSMAALFDQIKRATFCQPHGSQSFDHGNAIVIGSPVLHRGVTELSWAGYVIDFDMTAPSVVYEITDGMKPINLSGQRAIVANYYGDGLQLTYHDIEELVLDSDNAPLSFQQAMGAKKRILDERIAKATSEDNKRPAIEVVNRDAEKAGQETQLLQQSKMKQHLNKELKETFSNAEEIITKLETAFNQGFNEIHKNGRTSYLVNSTMHGGGYPLKKPLIREYANCLIDIKSLTDSLKKMGVA